MFKKLLALSAGVLITVAAYAAGAQLRADHPHTYVVKKGDTLWSISAKFLTKPWLWPEIWDVNQQVHNPHRIFPGDVLDLDVNGLHVAKHAEVEANPIPVVPLSQIQAFVKDFRVITAEQLKRTPYIVATQAAHPIATEGRDVYVRNLGAATVGERFAVVRPTHVYRQFNDDGRIDTTAHLVNNDVAVVGGPWQETFRNDGHYGRGRELGTEVQVIGTVRISALGDPATALLTNASTEIRAGDRLMPVDDAPYDAAYYPHAPRSAPNSAYVLAFANDFDSTSVVGTNSVVVLSIGSNQGVDNGATYSVFQASPSVPDDVTGNHDSHMFSHKVKLPDQFVGHVLVFRTFANVSYGLVVDGVRPVQVRDRIRSPD